MADNGKTAFGFAKKAAKRKDVGVNERTDDGAKKEFLTGVTGSGLELKDKVEKVVKSIPVRKTPSRLDPVGEGRRRVSYPTSPRSTPTTRSVSRTRICSQGRRLSTTWCTA